MSLFYVSNPLNNISGNIGKRNGPNVSAGSSPAYFETIMNIKSTLLKKSSGINAFISCMTADPDFITDRFIDAEDLDPYAYIEDLGSNVTIGEWNTDLREAIKSIGIDEEINGETCKTWVLNTLAGDSIKFLVRPDGVYNLLSDGTERLFEGIRNNSLLLSQKVVSISGKDVATWDAVKGVSIITEINDTLLDLIDLCLSKANGAVAAITALIAAAKDMTTDKLNVLKDALSSFCNDGFSGLRTYIIQFWYQLTNLTETSSGVLQFTDNSTLVPKIYIGGIISIIGTTLTAIGTALMATASRVVGAILAIVGFIANLISTKISNDYRSTYAGLDDDGDGLYGAPYGIFQGTSTPSPELEVPNVLASGSTLVYSVPGGYLIVGPDTNAGSYRYEFHPDLVNRETMFNTLNTRYNFFSKVSSYNEQTMSGTGHLYFNKTVADLWGTSSAEWHEFVSAAAGRSVNKNDAAVTESGTYAGYYSSSSQERLLKKIIAINTLLFFLWRNVTDWSEGNQPDQYFLYDYQAGWNWNTPTGAGSSSYNNALFVLYRAALDGEVGMLGNAMPSWVDLSNAMVALTSEITSAGYLVALGAGNIICYPDIHTYGEAMMVNGNTKFAMTVPAYDRASMISNLVATSLISAMVVAVAVFATVKAVKFVRTKRTMNALAVNQAYQTACDNPTIENVNAYRKAVLKNNLWASVIGGTKFSKTDYWFGSNGDSTASGVLAQAKNATRNMFSNGSEITLTDLYVLIAGHSPQI